jgi:hypothetical protein
VHRLIDGQAAPAVRGQGAPGLRYATG